MTEFLVVAAGMLTIGGIIAGAISIARLNLDGGWHVRYVHHCGFHDRLLGRIRKKVCPKCGEQTEPSDYGLYTARATFPFGWEFQKRSGERT